MKRIVFIICLIASVSFANGQGSLNKTWEGANSSYSNRDYKGAIAGYDSIARSGYGGVKLYYNLGNAYFKDQQIGKAIVNYNKALRLSPSDQDIIHNLKVAQSFAKDRIERVPEFFMKTWARDTMNFLSSNGWAVVSLLAFALALGFCALYLLASGLRLRKIGFYAGSGFALLFVIALIFSSIQRNAIRNPVEGVVIQSTAPVKSSPDTGSKDIFVLHEGTMVRVSTTLGDWKEVTIADGNKGWVLSNAIEMID